MKKSFAAIALMIIIGMAVMLAGCSPSDNTPSVKQQETTQEQTDSSAVQEDGKKIMVNLYFTNSDNSALPVEKREILVKDDAIMEAAVEALMEGPKDTNLRKAIPDGTKLLGIQKSGNVAVVNFSKEFNQVGGSSAEITARLSVVNTLTEIQGIEKVKFLLEGKDLIGASGEPLGEIGRAALDENGFPIPGEMKTLKLYFADAEAEKVVLEEREVPVSKGEKLEKAVFDELLKGPKTEGLQLLMSEGTRLLSVETRNGICQLNLSREFIANNHYGTSGESMMYNSIVNSLTEIPGVEKVQILVEGEVGAETGHMILDEPFDRNEDVIQK